MSAYNAWRFRAVSLSVSPFCKLDVVAERFTTSALRRKAASSKLVRVRVLGSTKKLTIVLPRNAGTFLISRVPTVLNAAVVSRSVRISSSLSSCIERRSLRCHKPGRGAGGRVAFISGFLQPDAFGAVLLAQPHVHALGV